MAAVGCAIILSTGIGSTSLLNAIAPALVADMSTTVTSYAVGPMLATICAFLGSLAGAKFIVKIGPRRCLLIGTVCVTVAICIIASAATAALWYAANIVNGIVLAIGAHAAAAGVGTMIMWASKGSMHLAYMSLVLCALVGPVQILPALFIPQLFGMKDYTAINSLGMGGFYLGGAATFVIVAAVMQGMGYNMGFIVLAACGIAALASFLLAIATSPMRKA